MFLGGARLVAHRSIALTLAGALACADGAKASRARIAGTPAGESAEAQSDAAGSGDGRLRRHHTRAARAADRLAQPRRPPSCSSRSAPGGRVVGPDALGPAPGRRDRAFPTSATAWSRTSRPCSARIPISWCIYASPSNRAAALQLRSGGRQHARDPRRSHQRLPPNRLDARARHRATPWPGRAIADSVERSLTAVRERPRPARPPTVFWHMWDSPVITIGARQLSRRTRHDRRREERVRRPRRRRRRR